MEIKIKYYWKTTEGKYYVNIAPVECLEGKGDKPFLGNSAWELVARCLFIGLKDKNSTDIFVGDRLRYENRDWEVKFGFHKTMLVEGEYWDYAYGFYLETELGVSAAIDHNTARLSEMVGNFIERN